MADVQVCWQAGQMQPVTELRRAVVKRLTASWPLISANGGPPVVETPQTV